MSGPALKTPVSMALEQEGLNPVSGLFPPEWDRMQNALIWHHGHDHMFRVMDGEDPTTNADRAAWYALGRGLRGISGQDAELRKHGGFAVANARRRIARTIKEPTPPKLVDEPATARPWQSRKLGECAWPVGTPGSPADQLSCCARTEGKTYCPEHSRIRRQEKPA